MFTGIIECTGTVVAAEKSGGNVMLTIRAPFSNELKIDQSVSHNGACLTVISTDGDTYRVLAVDETLKRTNLGELQPGNLVNLERSVRLGDRLDGHLVQGHVDTLAVVEKISEIQGSWIFLFKHESSSGNITVPKGSVCINGVSLTVVDSTPDSFSVTIIPYTMQHTSFSDIKEGDRVNVEFDIIGKYIVKALALQTVNP
ncbi:MAG: riboflavin synthase [Bacteroidia bacterium]|nr:riboflavin synthase [Bacteroidia bacterium]